MTPTVDTNEYCIDITFLPSILYVHHVFMPFLLAIIIVVNINPVDMHKWDVLTAMTHASLVAI